MKSILSIESQKISVCVKRKQVTVKSTGKVFEKDYFEVLYEGKPFTFTIPVPGYNQNKITKSKFGDHKYTLTFDNLSSSSVSEQLLEVQDVIKDAIVKAVKDRKFKLSAQDQERFSEEAVKTFFNHDEEDELESTHQRFYAEVAATDNIDKLIKLSNVSTSQPSNYVFTIPDINLIFGGRSEYLFSIKPFLNDIQPFKSNTPQHSSSD